MKNETRNIRKIVGVVGLILITIQSGWSQAPNWLTAGNANGTGFILGTTSGNFNLDIKNGASYPINFWTGGSQRGYFSSTGDFGISSVANAFQINSINVLHQNNSTSNLFGGANAGTNIPSASTDNTLFGYNAGKGSGSTTSAAIQNTFVGSNAGFSITTGANVSAFGYQALYNNTVSENCAFGSQALYTNGTGKPNHAFGYQALKLNSTGYDNTAFGQTTLTTNSTGHENSAFGNYSLESNSTGNYNTAMGCLSLTQNTASSNSAFGYNALNQNTSGTPNSAFGYNALSGMYKW